LATYHDVNKFGQIFPQSVRIVLTNSALYALPASSQVILRGQPDSWEYFSTRRVSLFKGTRRFSAVGPGPPDLGSRTARLFVVQGRAHVGKVDS
jgi:hypothetical protein